MKKLKLSAWTNQYRNSDKPFLLDPCHQIKIMKKLKLLAWTNQYRNSDKPFLLDPCHQISCSVVCIHCASHNYANIDQKKTKKKKPTKKPCSSLDICIHKLELKSIWQASTFCLQCYQLWEITVISVTLQWFKQYWENFISMFTLNKNCVSFVEHGKQ